MCREAGVILGITKELAEDARSGKHVLEYVFLFFNLAPFCCVVSALTPLQAHAEEDCQLEAVEPRGGPVTPRAQIC